MRPLDSRNYGVYVEIDDYGLERVGLTANDLVAIPAGVPLHVALDRALREVADNQLTWGIEDGIVTITSRKSADDFISPRAYDVGDLLGPNDDGEWLLQLLMSHTSGHWYAVSGFNGVASVCGNVLIVSQTVHVQREVAALLERTPHRRPAGSRRGTIAACADPCRSRCVVGNRASEHAALDGDGLHF